MVNSKGNTEKKRITRGITIPNFKLYYSHVNKNSMVLAQKQILRPVEQNRNLGMNPCSYTHLIFDKGTKNIPWRKDSLFNKCCWEKDICLKKTETRSMCATLYKYQLKVD
jgi:hypothetical protein